MTPDYFEIAKIAVRSRGWTPSEEYDDAFQDALVGAWQAHQTYEEGHGASLRTWMIHKAKYAIVDGYRERMVVSRAVVAKIKAARQGDGETSVPLWHLPPVNYMALLSPEDPQAEDLFVNIIVDDSAQRDFDRVTDEDWLPSAFAQLPPKLQWVLEQRFFAERNLLDIAGDLGVTESRVSQQVKEGLTRLRGILAKSLEDVGPRDGK